MALVFAASVPHPPLLVPLIGKENLDRLKDTIASYKELNAALKKSQAESLLLVSPHGELLDRAMSINLNPKYEYNFEDFGDFATRGELKGDIVLADWLKKDIEDKNILQLFSEVKIDHGTAVPLFLLLENLPGISVVPLYYSGLGLAEHYEFGRLIAPAIDSYGKKVAVVASGDLSHCLSKDAPGSYSPKGKKFDNRLIELLKQNNARAILKIDAKLIEAAGECGLKSILILLGILSGKKYKPDLLSYEAPFGVGYMAMNFSLR